MYSSKIQLADSHPAQPHEDNQWKQTLLHFHDSQTNK
jgi:hypothetical protein